MPLPPPTLRISPQRIIRASAFEPTNRIPKATVRKELNSVFLKALWLFVWLGLLPVGLSAEDGHAGSHISPVKPESLLVVGVVPQSARTGEPFAVPFTFAVKDAAGKPLTHVKVVMQLVSGNGQLSGDFAYTDADGQAIFENLVVLGPPGEVSFTAVTEGQQVGPFQVTLLPGSPRRIYVLTQPSRRVVSDSIFARALRVRVVDNAGNRLEKVELQVKLDSALRLPTRKLTKHLEEHPCNAPEVDAELFGPQVRRTDETGEVSFDSLGISGCPGRFIFRVGLPGEDSSLAPPVRTSAVVYDPDASFNKNYAAISAIKSIAGEIPDDEFFDIRFRFRISQRLSSIVWTDVALTSRSPDSTHSNQKKLTEALFSLNWRLHLRDDPRTGVPDREFFGSGIFKVFNTVPYAGAGFGSIELAGSAFEGSMLTVGGVWCLYSTPFISNGTTVRPQRFNLLADFLIRSESIDFFKSLNIRGSILLPAAHGQPLASRIGVAVPVGTLHLF